MDKEAVALWLSFVVALLFSRDRKARVGALLMLLGTSLGLLVHYGALTRPALRLLVVAIWFLGTAVFITQALTAHRHRSAV